MSDPRADAVAAVFSERRDEIVRLAWAVTGDGGLAEELAQEAFVRLYIHWSRLRDPLAAPAYLRRIVINLSRSALRRRGRERLRPQQPPEDYETAAEAVRIDLLAVVGRLPTRQRACVVLRFYLDLSEADTAEALGTSVGTVKSQTFKALRHLEQWLGTSTPSEERAAQP